MNKPTVGQKVWLKPIGNAARYRTDIRESVITKVGNKYFDCHLAKFDFNGNQNNGQHPANYVCFFSEQEIKDNVENEELTSKIKKLFAYGKLDLTLEQLRAINEIINATKNI